ncbi:c-5 sterol desaturase [Grosmannia clavigera kw1407]|uniref:C-5 sterol desaturase n=1 Tax=Grosmannia clavigera (strain kw1407 / UAMH 11150) TaxID=655863 RepID=F0XPN2_GROCL|nr:c-5 sterol desaturase [Grosmannia clavigera kw1407]EFX00745.1 c-5 sterol desaturase [Grosmannia clavigera kw1407]
MDIALEIMDTYGFDYVYSTLLPAPSAPYNLASSDFGGNATALSSWTYKPTSFLFTLEPSKYAYMSAWNRDNMLRQYISLFLITWIFGLFTYFLFSTLSYVVIFDKKTAEHPKYLKNQVWLEIKQASTAMPVMALLTAPFFLAEVRGYGKLYEHTSDGPGRWYDIAQMPFFLFFTDMFVYMIHRGLHHPAIYKNLHKPHHKWIMPTPFASYAFHPVDGWMQSLPYHIYPMILPLQKWAYLALFIIINFWTIMIHDGEFVSDNPIINGAACHSVHHYAFNYNYGQYFTLWDRIGGSYRCPDKAVFDKKAKMSKETWKQQVDVMEDIIKEVEGEDDRIYDPVVVESKKSR